jgi:DNA repair protein RecO (recombination protein O)
MLTKDIAICIKAVDYSETSQIVTFFTKTSGKISAIAKGSKRHRSSFGGPIEIFSYGNIIFSETGTDKLATLTEFELIQWQNGYTTAQNDLFTLNCSLFALELLGKLTQDYDPHPELFDGFLQFLKNTRDSTNINNILLLLILFQLQLLTQVGLQPVLTFCANCKTKYEIRDTNNETYFSSTANGLICRDCQGAFHDIIRLSLSAANCLSNLKMLPQAQDTTLEEIERVLIAHFTEILGHQPKMIKYFRKILW